MNKWVIGAGVVGGVGLLIWLTKKSADSFAAKAAAITPPGPIGPSATPAVTVAPGPTVPAPPTVTPVTSAVPAPAATPAAAQPYAPAQQYVPIYAMGQLTGQSILWTASDDQSKIAGPRYPDFYELDTGRFIFNNANGSGYIWVTLDPNSGAVTSSGTSPAQAA